MLQSMQLSYDYAKDRALMCLRANYESHLSKSHMPAKGGSYLHVRPWLLLHWHARIHGHGYTFTGMRMHACHCHTCTAMRTLARPCAHRHVYAHGHAHIASGTSPTRPARPAYANLRILPTHSNSNVQRLGGMGVDAGVNVDVRGGTLLHV